METLQEILSVFLLVLGFSYLLQGRTWAKLSKAMVADPGMMFIPALIILPFGLAIVSVHNVWVADLPVVFTILGWALTIKMTLFLVFPNSFKSFEGMSEDTVSKMVRVSGAVMTVLGAILVYRFVISG